MGEGVVTTPLRQQMKHTAMDQLHRQIFGKDFWYDNDDMFVQQSIQIEALYNTAF